MAKILRTQPFPSGLVKHDPEALVLTPHPAAARALGVPHIKLETLAAKILERNGLAVASPVVSRRLLRRAIGNVTSERDRSAYADRIGPALETILRTGIDTGKLAEHCSGPVRVLAKVADAYNEELMRQGLVDSSACMIRAAGLAGQHHQIVIYGYFRGRKEEIELINAAAGEGSEYYLPCSPDGILEINIRWRDELVARGWQVAEDASEKLAFGQTAARHFLGKDAGPGLPDAISCGGKEEEVRYVLGQAKKLIAAGTPAYEIAIVCEALDDYVDTLSAVSAEYGLPLNIGLLVPIRTTAVGGMLNLLIEAIENGLEFEPTARLMMQAFGAEIDGGRWQKLRHLRPAGLNEWREYLPDVEKLDATGERSLNEWERDLRGWLDIFGVKHTAADNARELAAYYEFLDALRETVEAEGRSAVSFEAFASYVNDILATTLTPYSLFSAGLDVLKPDTVIGGRYRHVFILGLAEGVHPAAVVDNVVVDFYERKHLATHGLEFESAADISRWAAATFFLTLQAAGETLTLSYPRSMENAEKLPSPFFDLLGVKTAEAKATTISSVEEWRRRFLQKADADEIDPLIAEVRRRYAVEYERENRPGSGVFDGIIGRQVDPSAIRWSVSQFTQIGQCPFKWFAARLLRLDVPEEAAGELHPAKRGSLYHKALELAIAAESGEEDMRARILNNLEEAFARAEEDPEVALPALPNWELQRADHLRHLRKAVESPEFISDGAVVLAVEKEFHGDWEGLKMIGFIDRIDDTPEGLIAIDYKTSSKAPKGIKDETGKLTVDVQLPLYTHVALRNLFPDKKLGVGAYYSLTNGKVIKTAGLEGMEKLSGFPDTVKRVLAEGRFPVLPDTDESACEYCDFDAVCRRGPRLKKIDAV